MDNVELGLTDFLPPELVTRLKAANSQTDSLEDIYALTEDALFEISKLYVATLDADKVHPGAYVDMLAILQKAILQGIQCWARARAVLGPLKR